MAGPGSLAPQSQGPGGRAVARHHELGDPPDDDRRRNNYKKSIDLFFDQMLELVSGNISVLHQPVFSVDGPGTFNLLASSSLSYNLNGALQQT